MDQISLKDIINLVIKNKWIILGFTMCCVIISLVVSYIVIKPVYSARTVFNISPVEIKTGICGNSAVINESLSSGETYNSKVNRILGTILNKISYPKYDTNAINSILNGIEFKDKIYDKYKIDKSVVMISSGNIDINQISVVSQSGKSNDIVKANNAVVEYLPEYISGELMKRFEATKKIVSDGLAEEKSNLIDIRQKMEALSATTNGAIYRDSGNMKVKKDALLSDDAIIRYRELLNEEVLAAQAFDSYKLVEKEMSMIKPETIIKQLNISLVSSDANPLKIMPKVKVNVILAAAFGFMFILFVLMISQFVMKKESIRK